MAESMVEKVAKDIAMADLNVTAKTHPDMPMERLADLLQKVVANGHYDAMARAAIEAMRDPTLEMINAGEGNVSAPEDVRYVFASMIDAALSEEVAG